MREIIFRGKRKDTAEWVQGGSLLALKDGERNLFFIPKRGEWCTTRSDDINNVFSIEGNLFYWIDAETLGESSGVIDKAGQLIFEGDIVQSRASENPKDWKYWAVRYKDGNFEFTYEYTGKKPFIMREPVCKDNVELYGLKVVGNIFDNPELKCKGKIKGGRSNGEEL